ncbi:MAG TPA: hypothetical protein VGP55_07525 [Chitinophagaceae bacterium]|nr:hypothetical protein [Chitinophagaceae bacterium]
MAIPGTTGIEELLKLIRSTFHAEVFPSLLLHPHIWQLNKS